MPQSSPSHDPELARRLVEGTRRLGLSISAAQATQLLSYLAGLERWNRVHNLSGQGSPSDFLVQHVFDSMTLVGPLTRYAKGRSLRVLDAGSGAGFPAVVVAVMRPDWLVAAVDAVAKKMAFARQAANEAGIANLVMHHVRLERFQPAERFNVVVSRAFASLDGLVTATEHLLAANGVWVAMKGRSPSSEIAGLAAGVQAFHVEPVTVPGLNAERNLIWMCRST